MADDIEMPTPTEIARAMGVYPLQAKFIYGAEAIEPQMPDDVVERIKEALAEVRRTVVCEPQHVEGLEKAIEEEGLASVVRVIGNPYCVQGKAYVFRGWLA